MKGKHCKSRFPLSRTPRVAGAVVGGLAVVGVVAGTASATIFDSDSAGSVAAVETVQPPAQPNGTAKREGRAPADSGSAKKDESAAKAEAKTSDAMSARDKVIELARTWRPGTGDRVPYSQSAYHNGYRTDCSGYVSMTLGLSKPGENTVGLTSPSITERIEPSELKKGDLLIDAQGTNTTRHVVIFEKWANADKTSYWAFEQRGRYGTDHRTRDYGLDSGSEFKAYRPKNL